MDDPIQTFAAEARRFCTLVENYDQSNSWVFAQKCLSAVLRLSERALSLPNLEPNTVDLLDRIDSESWQAIRNRLGQNLARDHYWEIFEPLEEEQPEAVVGLISDDLADIWRDVKVGLIEIDRGKATSTGEAVWQWRFSFETHWAKHAAGAIAALTALCFGEFADTSRPQEPADHTKTNQ